MFGSVGVWSFRGGQLKGLPTSCRTWRAAYEVTSPSGSLEDTTSIAQIRALRAQGRDTSSSRSALASGRRRATHLLNFPSRENTPQVEATVTPWCPRPVSCCCQRARVTINPRRVTRRGRGRTARLRSFSPPSMAFLKPALLAKRRIDDSAANICTSKASHDAATPLNASTQIQVAGASDSPARNHRSPGGESLEPMAGLRNIRRPSCCCSPSHGAMGLQQAIGSPHAIASPQPKAAGALRDD